MASPAPLAGSTGVLGVECAASVGGAPCAAIVSSSSPAFAYNTRALITSGPAASGLVQSLIGYAPSNTAGSGFNLTCQAPKSGSSAIITAALGGGNTGITVTLGFGGAGGVSVDGCICTSCAVSGTEGGDITIALSFVSTTLPAPGGGGTPAAAPFFTFNDVKTVGGHADCTSFTWRVTRNVARYTGNSGYGIAKHLKISRTECSADIEYLKVDDGAGSAAIAQPITPADVSIVLAEAPFISAGSGALTLVCVAAFQDGYPTTTGDFESFVSERATYKSSTGKYTAS